MSLESGREAGIGHSLTDDVTGMVSGVVLASLSMYILASAGLVTGQTAGVALLLSHVTGWNIGLVFFLVNLPFYVFAMLRMGWGFTLRTFVAVALLSALTAMAPALMPLGPVHPVAAAVCGAVLAGVGLVVLFRHRASLGGIGILGLYLQQRTGFRAGWFQLIVDAVIFACALAVLDLWQVVVSAGGALLLNVLVALNHRSDRYIAR